MTSAALTLLYPRKSLRINNEFRSTARPFINAGRIVPNSIIRRKRSVRFIRHRDRSV